MTHKHNTLEHLHFIKVGPRSFTQDLGRFGFQDIGITSGGCADKYAAHWANQLLGNNHDAALIEFILANTHIRFSAATRIALCGAPCTIKLNDETKSAWSSFDVQAGDILKLGLPSSGLYTYLAVLGGLQLDKVLGSYAISAREHIGPNNGKALIAGDTLNYLSAEALLDNDSPIFNKSPHWEKIPDYRSELTLRIFPGADFKDFDQEHLKLLLEGEYRIASNSNKMGIRLEGAALRVANTPRLSEGVVPGTIQIPPSGQPIILMAEHQTIGGYPKIAGVYKSDCAQLAQRRPGQSIRFVLGSIEDAQEDYKHFLKFFAGAAVEDLPPS